MFRTTRITMAYALLAGCALLATSCSGDNPVSSSAQSTRGLSSLTSLHDTEFFAHIATIDLATRQLTFSDSPELVTIDASAEIERSTGSGGSSVPITFADLTAGDFVRVRGNRQSDGSVLADHVEVKNGDDNGEDEDDELESIITSINYTDSSFTVASRTETIRVTAGTLITGHVRGGGAQATDDGGDDSKAGGDDGRDTVIALESLIVGDSVEVHFLTIDASTLEATRIEMEDEMGEDEDVEFKDVLATVDVTAGVVTFQTQTWIGTIDPNAVLQNLSNQPVALSAFAPGQLVEVKGFPQAGDTLLVVRMEMDNN